MPVGYDVTGNERGSADSVGKNAVKSAGGRQVILPARNIANPKLVVG